MLRRLTPAEGWPTVGLVAALVWATLKTVEAAGWGERLALTPPIAIIGMLVGLLAAKSKLRTIWAMPLGLGIGYEVVFVLEALTGPGEHWVEKLRLLSAALWEWYLRAMSQGASHDPLVFATVVAGVGYLLGFCSSWLVFRLQSGWLALIANATSGIIHLSYATVDSVPPFLGSLFVGVLAVASLELHLRRGAWQSIGVQVQSGSTLWTLVTAGGLTGLALVAAAQLPAGQINTELASRYQAAMEPWKDFQKQIDKLVGGGRGQARPGGGLAFSSALMPREDFELGTRPVLKISSPQRRYWRTTTYDLYDGHSMQISESTERRYPAAQSLPSDPRGGAFRTTIDQRVLILADSASALLAADTPVSASVDVFIDQRQVDWDLAGVRFVTPLQRGQSYQVTSAVSQAGRHELAQASRDYPDWLDQYIQLPSDLPPRIGGLTNRLTVRTENVYERALAVEAYLRSMTYSTRTVAPPPDRDWVDFLVFDSRAGYCDYFATAMMVMLRTQGIPARVASGFAPGVYDEQERAWIVRENEAHSWTEVYFPDIGWVTFEPSALRPIPERPESARNPSASAGGLRQVGPMDDQFDDLDGFAGGTGAAGQRGVAPTSLGLALLSLAAGLLLVGFLLAAISAAWERGLTDEPPPRRRYGQVRRLLSWARWRIPDSATPYELAEMVAEAQPELADPLRRLVRRHVETTYGPGSNADADAEAEAAWLQLRAPLANQLLHGGPRATARDTAPEPPPSETER